MANLKNIPEYVPGHGLLKGKRVVITAAAGTGIGFAAAKKCIEEGATVFISDIHEGRLQKAQATLEAETGQRPDFAICNVTNQDLHKVTSKELLAELEAKEAYGRGSEVWEQANVMVFLASDYSSYMTGEVISTSSQRA